ncbi:hypothetical protein [Rhodanobacter lindaniclasticus]
MFHGWQWVAHVQGSSVCRRDVLFAPGMPALERVVGRRSRYHVSVQLKNRGAVGAIVSAGMMNPRVVVRSGGWSAAVAPLLRVVGHDNKASQLANNFGAAGSLPVNLGTSVDNPGAPERRQQAGSMGPRVFTG